MQIASSRWACSLALLLCLLPRPLSAAELTIATGSEGGVYYPVGVAIARLLERQGIAKVRVVVTAGSIENIELLRTHEADLAIVQGDLLHLSQMAREGEEFFQYRDDVGRFRGVAALFPEYTQILVRNDDHRITLILNLVDKRIHLGKPGSGTRKNALEILSSRGLSASDYESVLPDASQPEAIDALMNGSVDAVFTTTGELQTYVEEYRGRIRMLSLDEEAKSRRCIHPQTRDLPSSLAGGSSMYARPLPRLVLASGWFGDS